MKALDPLIGSGYVRLGVSSNEGATIPEELRVNIARERTKASSTFMGLTVGCAVCHDREFDPTTQHDFYALTRSSIISTKNPLMTIARCGHRRPCSESRQRRSVQPHTGPLLNFS